MYKIDFKSIFQKGITPIKEDFGIYLICGYQGSGKGYFSTYNLITKHSGQNCKTNVKTLKTPNNKIEYFTKIEDIYNDTEDHYVYIIDELSKKFPKNAPLDRAFYSWLQQSRKKSRYVYLITQEYINVPQWLRGVANMVYVTSKIRFLPLFVTYLGRPILNDEMEWTIEIKDAIVYKRTLEVASSYDTLEGIEQL